MIFKSIAFFFCLFLPLSIIGKEVTGKVVAIDGAATTGAKGKKKRPLKRGSVIFTDEMIHVQDGSKLQIRFSDGGLLNLIPNTKYQIKAYSYTENKSTNQFIGQVFVGGFRHLTGEIGKDNPDRVRVRTPTTTIGVRGTLFEVLVLPNQIMTVGCLLGQISVEAPQGQIALGPSQPYQFSTVAAGGKPEGLTSRPSNFGADLFSSPVNGIQTSTQTKPESFKPPPRIKGGC